MITLVENRPVLCDKISESCKTNQFSFTAWMEICKMLCEHFDTLSDKKSIEYTKFFSFLFILVALFYTNSALLLAFSF